VPRLLAPDVTDRLDCPDCNGTGEYRIGPLVLLCQFCRGAGYVGDDNEPAEEHPPGPPPPIWKQVGAVSPGCPVCFGAGEVVNLGDQEPALQVIRSPCPACSGQRAGP
jgi:DnaJ-class molecular chaperone